MEFIVSTSTYTSKPVNGKELLKLIHSLTTKNENEMIFIKKYTKKKEFDRDYFRSQYYKRQQMKKNGIEPKRGRPKKQIADKQHESDEWLLI